MNYNGVVCCVCCLRKLKKMVLIVSGCFWSPWAVWEAPAGLCGRISSSDTQLSPKDILTGVKSNETVGEINDSPPWPLDSDSFSLVVYIPADCFPSGLPETCAKTIEITIKQASAKNMFIKTRIKTCETYKTNNYIYIYNIQNIYDMYKNISTTYKHIHKTNNKHTQQNTNLYTACTNTYNTYKHAYKVTRT